jgi:adenosine deaminase
VEVAVIVDAVNHLGPAHGHAVLDLIEQDLPPFVVGFSTGGLERVPFREWAPVFHRARKAGLKIAAHAGENGPGANVREAILEGGVERIVHGVRAADDPALMDLLVARGIPVDVCPTSNRALIPDLGIHPLDRMLKSGVRCALGTDDPGVIPCDLEGEWNLAVDLGVDAAGLEALNRHAVEDAWCLKGR